MSDKEIIFSILHHFINDGWALRVKKHDANVIQKYCPYLEVTPAKEKYEDRRNYHVKLINKISLKHQLIYYKRQLKDSEKLYEELYNRVVDIIQEF